MKKRITIIASIISTLLTAGCNAVDEEFIPENTVPFVEDIVIEDFGEETETVLMVETDEIAVVDEEEILFVTSDETSAYNTNEVTYNGSYPYRDYAMDLFPYKAGFTENGSFFLQCYVANGCFVDNVLTKVDDFIVTDKNGATIAYGDFNVDSFYVPARNDRFFTFNFIDDAVINRDVDISDISLNATMNWHSVQNELVPEMIMPGETPAETYAAEMDIIGESERMVNDMMTASMNNFMF